jgi:hypothetical protein
MKLTFLIKRDLIRNVIAYLDYYSLRSILQSSEFRVQSSELRAQSSEFRVQSSELRVQSSEFRVQSSEFSVQSSEFRAQTSEFKAQSSEFRVQSPELRLQSSEFRAQTSEFRVQSSELRVQSSEFRVQPQMTTKGMKIENVCWVKNINDFYVNFDHTCQDHTFAARIQAGIPSDNKRNENGKCLMGKKASTIFL